MVLTGLALAALSGCSDLTPAGLVQGVTLDPLTTDPAQIVVAVGLSEAVPAQPKTAALFLGYDVKDPVSADIATEITLTIDADDRLAGRNVTDDQIFVFSIAPQDAAALRQTQSQIRDLKDDGVDGLGTLSIHVKLDCLPRNPGPDQTLSTWLSTDQGVRFVPLTRETVLSDYINALAISDITPPPACDAE
ncbi:MAG: hypothetical protein AAF826_04225 [Pseudomonadota bacterium]